ncbi:MAG: Asp-tRNA(Asn)/Glu-tRNA(Gln) amidotransferase GatCAB subunit A [Chloroflexi bacterium]|nr:Asp-tRNA(Asn)/Glu-tRNA(Gln) amidotransferase GatCAB subunit A [Chloroflexota bacterium]|tara:strand:- start:273 stop:1784 length:1512 start_codon:yes stop_codon:yes gene_type:complete
MFEHPTKQQLRACAEDLGMSLSEEYLDATSRIVGPLVEAYQALDSISDNLPEVKYPRGTGTRPEPHQNPDNAWYVKTSIKGAPDGKLAGKRVAIKDNICVAGVQMMNGASVLEGYVPEVDATVVTRILDAGGEIAGKAVCEYFCVSGTSSTSSTGPVHNPYRRGYSAGGSSSGSAALVASGEVDFALGGDQAGSIRIPASYCGVYGMKGTFGLVPYTGAISLETTIDHCGPITNNVRNNALLLEVIAGADGIDSRQANLKTSRYTEALEEDITGLRVGVVAEGFGHHNSQADVDAKVRSAAERIALLGADVIDISIPMHSLTRQIWIPIGHDGGFRTMLGTHGAGGNHQGLYLQSLINATSGWQDRSDEFADTLKIIALFSHYSLKHYRGQYYAKAMNLRRKLRIAYDTALNDVDLLLMPTLPMKASKLPAADAMPEDTTDVAWEMLANTCGFNLTGHPAMSLPCGISDDLPIGLMLIGRHWEEATIYRAAHCFEQYEDWKNS